jgi:hypothetical protein
MLIVLVPQTAERFWSKSTAVAGCFHFKTYPNMQVVFNSKELDSRLLKKADFLNSRAQMFRIAN